MAERELPELVNETIRAFRREADIEAKRAEATKDPSTRLDHQALSILYGTVALQIERAVGDLEQHIEEAAHAHSHAYEIEPDQPAETASAGSADDVAGGE